MSETKRRRTEITIETHQLTIIRVRNGKTDSVFCGNCQQNVAVFSPPNAALIFRVGAELLETLFQTGQIHFVSENSLCGNSLADFFKQEIRYIED